MCQTVGGWQEGVSEASREHLACGALLPYAISPSWFSQNYTGPLGLLPDGRDPSSPVGQVGTFNLFPHCTGRSDGPAGPTQLMIVLYVVKFRLLIPFFRKEKMHQGIKLLSC